MRFDDIYRLKFKKRKRKEVSWVARIINIFIDNFEVVKVKMLLKV